MGADLFDRYAELVRKADDVLGYSIRRLCLDDPDQVLTRTQYTQPALYVVNALSYLRETESGALPDYVLGHSLGEYSALFAAGAFDFETGLRLVKRRGELMAQASGGAMAAVVNCAPTKISDILRSNGLDDIDIANFNSPMQTVVSGPKQSIGDAGPVFTRNEAVFIPINVSAAFHSRYMQPAAEAMRDVLARAVFSAPRIPVIANATARPYGTSDVADNLQRQIVSPVQWLDSIRYLMGAGVTELKEIGPGDVLTKLTRAIQRTATPLDARPPAPPVAPREVTAASAPPPPRDESSPVASASPRSSANRARTVAPERLGSAEFRSDYNVRLAYVAGGMVKAIASKELVVRMARAGLLAYYGTGGVEIARIERELQYIQSQLQRGEPYGVNLLANLVDPRVESDVVELLLRYGVCNAEAAAYTQLTAPLVKFRLRGLSRDRQGSVAIRHRVLAKVSRPEVADLFLNPPGERLVKQLVSLGAVTPEQAELSQRIPMADDICVEADSGGHTDMGIVTVLLPTIARQRDAACARQRYARRVRVGTAGGVGTPEAAASAFMLGADFVLTGSINQCTVEAGTSDIAKDMLADMNVQDTDYAPAGDMFELGAQVQVLKRGVLFAPRANKLHELWRNHQAWDQIDAKARQQIESKYFGRSFDEVYRETRDYYLRTMPQQIEKAESNPRHKLALVFRWYFVHTMRLALEGNTTDRVNYQVHTGPAMGAFNQWVKGTGLEAWRARHVDEIGEILMQDTARLLNERLTLYLGA